MPDWAGIPGAALAHHAKTGCAAGRDGVAACRWRFESRKKCCWVGQTMTFELVLRREVVLGAHSIYGEFRVPSMFTPQPAGCARRQRYGLCRPEP